MNPEACVYPGTELDVFAGASTWRRYWSEQVKPFVQGDVLEVGAGIGSVISALRHPGLRSWVALEPDSAMAEQLRRNAWVGAPRVEVVASPLSQSGVPVAGFDSALYIDVLEHIDADAEELRCAISHLRPGGHLIVLSPAHEALYSPFDEAIGHFRRYSRKTLARLTPPGAELRVLRYLDCAGLVASLGNRLLLRSGEPTSQQVSVWDRGLVPISRLGDRALRYRLGKSVLAVWQAQ